MPSRWYWYVSAENCAPNMKRFSTQTSSAGRPSGHQPQCSLDSRVELLQQNAGASSAPAASATRSAASSRRLPLGPFRDHALHALPRPEPKVRHFEIGEVLELGMTQAGVQRLVTACRSTPGATPETSTEVSTRLASAPLRSGSRREFGPGMRRRCSAQP